MAIGQSSAVASVLREDYNVFVLLEILNFSDRLSPLNDDIHSSISLTSYTVNLNLSNKIETHVEWFHLNLNEGHKSFLKI